jgi:hypothetical protein
MRRFLGEVFTDNTIQKALGVLAVIAVLLYLFLDQSAAWQWKLVGTVIAALSYLTILFALAAYRFYYQFSRRLKVLKQVVQANSDKSNDYIIVFENPEFLREGCIVSLVDCRSGADQTIGLLQVTRSQSHEPLQAKTYPLGTPQADIGSIIDRLYVSPMVHNEALSKVTARPLSFEAFYDLFQQAFYSQQQATRQTRKKLSDGRD